MKYSNSISFTKILRNRGANENLKQDKNYKLFKSIDYF